MTTSPAAAPGVAPAATEVDARGMRCPWPALRLAKAMRGANAVRLLADDPAAPREVAALAAEHGWAVTWEGDVCLVRRQT